MQRSNPDSNAIQNFNFQSEEVGSPTTVLDEINEETPPTPVGQSLEWKTVQEKERSFKANLESVSPQSTNRPRLQSFGMSGGSTTDVPYSPISQSQANKTIDPFPFAMDNSQPEDLSGRILQTKWTRVQLNSRSTQTMVKKPQAQVGVRRNTTTEALRKPSQIRTGSLGSSREHRKHVRSQQGDVFYGGGVFSASPSKPDGHRDVYEGSPTRRSKPGQELSHRAYTKLPEDSSQRHIKTEACTEQCGRDWKHMRHMYEIPFSPRAPKGRVLRLKTATIVDNT